MLNWESHELIITVVEQATLAAWLGLTETAEVPKHELQRTTVVLVKEGDATA